MRKILVAMLGLLCASPASAQLTGPSFTPTGFSGTSYVATGGAVAIAVTGLGGVHLVPQTHFFVADANGGATARVLDFGDWLYSLQGGPAVSVSNFPTTWLDLGTFSAGAILRFGVITDYPDATPVYGAGRLTYLDDAESIRMEMWSPTPSGATRVEFALKGIASVGGGICTVNSCQTPVSTVPEPSTWLLLAMGAIPLGLLAGYRRRA